MLALGRERVLKANLLATKLHRPALPPQWVARPTLTQRLQEGLALNRQLTLVSAPAGFGKTTCISDWLNSLEAWPAAWLSLDAADNDPGRFFAYFVAGLQTVAVDFGQALAAVLQAGQLPPPDALSASLINEMLTIEERFLLVLDDFHLLQEPSVLQVLDTIVANLPPALHLVLITREDPPLPLARLRANNQLTEIRARDLRFTGEDAARLLNDGLNLSLSAADVAALETKTEGWIAGLQLAALSLRERADPAQFIATLSGSHRFILDYLTEQVLSQQTASIQHFLLQTSILDKFNSELCDAVTGREDGRSLLEQLFNANLFLISLDETQQWYRYHHLFADLLRARQQMMGKQETAVLHQRASQWYAQENMIPEAMQHALAAEDFTTAVALLEGYAMPLIMQGYVKTVHGWVEAIPDAWRCQSHKTNLAFAWMHLLRGAYAQAEPYLAQLENAFASDHLVDEPHQAIRAEWLVLKSLLLNKEAKILEAAALVDEALALVPPENGRVRSLAYFGRATSYQALEKFDEAVAAYQQAIQLGRRADNLIAEMLSVSGLAVMAFEQGKLHLAFEIAAPVIERVEQAGSLSPITTVVYGILGEICYQWHQPQKAQHYFQRALELSTLGGYQSGMINCRVLLSRLAYLEGELELAVRHIKEAAALLQSEVPDYVRQEVLAQQVGIYLAQDRSAAAQALLQEAGFSFRAGFTFPPLAPEQTISHSLGLLYNSSLRFLLHWASSGHRQAPLTSGIELAGQIVEKTQPGRSTAVALEALLLRAQMHAALADQSASWADYCQALALAEPEGFIGVFLEQGKPAARAIIRLAQQRHLAEIEPGYLKRLLAALANLLALPEESVAVERPFPPEVRPLVEPLTEREREVLSLMAEGLKYKEIAARLIVSLNTVRYHVKAIYGKLNVNNRTQALETARQQQIL